VPPLSEVQRPPARRILRQEPSHLQGIKSRPSVAPLAVNPPKARGSIALAIQQASAEGAEASEPPSGPAATTPPPTIPGPGTPPPSAASERVHASGERTASTAGEYDRLDEGVSVTTGKFTMDAHDGDSG